MSGGNRIAGSTRIPIAEMAKAHVREIFPQLTEEEAKALQAGKPLPGRERTSAADADTATQELRRLVGIFEAGIDGATHLPLVSAILVVSDARRRKRAQLAVNQFVAQSYVQKQLVVVNASGTPITTVPHRQIKEVPWTPAADEIPTTGGLRNFGLALADGDVIYPHWDDDDLYDPHLLAYMMSQYADGKALLLASQIRVDVKNSVAYQHYDQNGIPNSMIFPAGVVTYPLQTGGEDVAVWSRYFGVKSRIVDNTAWPVNSLKICVYDGNNVATVEQFMGAHADPSKHRRIFLNDYESAYMRAALTARGFKIEQAPAAV